MNSIQTASPAQADAYLQNLRRRIGWICQTVRFAAIGYAAWVLLMVIRFWSDGDAVTRVFQHRLRDMALSEPLSGQRMAGLAISLADWLLVAAAVYSVWRMMENYLAGHIFSVDAAEWLKRVGLFGLAALAFDFLARPVTTLIMSSHMPGGGHFTGFFVLPHDLLNALFLLAFVALAHIFRCAAAMAEDHAQIV